MRSLTIPIQAGRLTVETRREDLPLESCLSYATRQNPKRLYLFVSKVLGKHWPVRPGLMREVHARLAAKIADLPGPLLVIGLAERVAVGANVLLRQLVDVGIGAHGRHLDDAAANERHVPGVIVARDDDRGARVAAQVAHLQSPGIGVEDHMLAVAVDPDDR